ncbi:uncharacterized protein V2V93DRAFT_356273 [Kockiozyma suomiensis]|uniref:uncharacterized protein n=1 Tax=Kockiozyma suomiensis TaxID=1337062 RepID=UPI0033433026
MGISSEPAENVIVVLLQVNDVDSNLSIGDSHITSILSHYGTVLYSSFLLWETSKAVICQPSIQVLLALSIAQQLPPKIITARSPKDGILIDCLVEVIAAPKWCRYCRRVGHKRVACPEAPECDYCLSKGHSYRRCPTQAGEINGKCISVEYE